MTDLGLHLPLNDDDLADTSLDMAGALAGPAFDLYDLTVIDPEKLERAIQVFHEHDGDANGLLSVSELQRVVEELALQSEALQGILSEAEETASGVGGMIGLDEFLAMVRAVYMESDNPEGDESRIRRAFAHIDKDNNQELDLEEFKLAMGMLGRRYSEDEVVQAFNTIDTNDNGAIDYEEFVSYLTKDRKTAENP